MRRFILFGPTQGYQNSSHSHLLSMVHCCTLFLQPAGDNKIGNSFKGHGAKGSSEIRAEKRVPVLDGTKSSPLCNQKHLRTQAVTQ
jgi:hypothetical protein